MVKPTRRSQTASQQARRVSSQRVSAVGKHANRSATAATKVKLPKQLGPYRVLARLGRGGMNHVVRARHEGLDREVALKVLPPQHAQSASKLARFQHEARMAAAVSHAHINTCFDTGSDQGWYFLACDLLTNGDLRQLIKDRQQPWGEIEALRLVRQMASGVQALHEADILHRDIKPANILLNDRGEPQLADFGVAIGLHQQQAGDVVGSAIYMSPEAMRGAMLAPSSDVFSLAVCLFELIAGTVPFQRKSAEIREGQLPDLSLHAPSVRCFHPHLSREVDALLQRALLPDAGQRYPSAAALVQAIDMILRPETSLIADLNAMDLVQPF